MPMLLDLRNAGHVQRAVAADVADGAALIDETAVAGLEQRIGRDPAQVNASAAVNGFMMEPGSSVSVIA